MLRKPDPRRQLTQTWHFTEDGRLCCGHSNVFVQAKDGFYGIRQGMLNKHLTPSSLSVFKRHPNDGSMNISQAFPVKHGECVRRF